LQDRTVSSFAEKAHSKLFKPSHNCSKVNNVKLLPTHKQKRSFVVSTPGFS